MWRPVLLYGVLTVLIPPLGIALMFNHFWEKYTDMQAKPKTDFVMDYLSRTGFLRHEAEKKDL